MKRDGIAPKELVLLLARQWRWALATLGIVILIAMAALTQVKPQWQAQATIRVGQVYDALEFSVRPIEPLQDVLVRLQGKSIPSELSEGGGPPPEANASRPVNGSASFDLVPLTSLIHVTARASSAESAKYIATELFKYLASVHEELARAAHSDTELLTGQYTAELSAMREVQSNLRKAFSAASNSNTDDAVRSLATIGSAMERSAEEITKVELQKLLLTRRNVSYSVSTEMLGEVRTTRVVSVPRSLAISFSLIMGVAAGLMVALLRDYAIKKRVQRLSA